MKNNKYTATGTISTEIEYDHTVFSGEKIYKFTIDIPRKSSTIDKISVLILESFLRKHDFKKGDFVKIEGSLRSYNIYNHVLLNLFVEKIDYADVNYDDTTNNNVNLIGFICKKPIYRVTPLGKKITDIIIAVNRSPYVSDYIPCICWGKDAIFVSSLAVGTKLKLSGRFQSRIYLKKLDDGEEIEKTAYELSVHKISIIDD